MLMLGAFLLGGLLGRIGDIWEQHLVKTFDEEIEKEIKWPVWVMPLFNGVIAGITYYEAASPKLAFVNIIWMSLFLLLACFDFKYMLLPTRIIGTGIVLALIWQLVQYITLQDSFALKDSLLGGAVGFAMFWLVFYGSKLLLKREGLGYGDVRLMAFIGLVIGLSQLFLMIIVASFLAVVVGIVLYIVRKESRAFPFGPFLCGGAMIMILFGSQIIGIYLNAV